MSHLKENEKKEINETFKILDEIEKIKNDPNLNKIFFKKYKVKKKIAEGSFGSIYEGIEIKTQNKIAIKLEERNKSNILEKEAYNLLTLKGYGIVELISFGRNIKYNIMIQPLLSDSLYKIFLNYKKKITLKDIFLIGLQCLDRIEWIHMKNIIHRDIKPENFLLRLIDPRIISLIDFGLSKKYRSERTLKHIQFSLTKKLTGTARYASINALKGFELSRRDDLESFCYMMIYFILKKLPWQGVKAQTYAKRYKKICEIKEEFNIDNYGKIIPKEMIIIFKYVRKLKFDEKPNYNKLRILFESFLKQVGYNKNDTFSWIKDEGILNLKRSYDFHRKKSSVNKRLFEKITKIDDKTYSRDVSIKNNLNIIRFTTSPNTCNLNSQKISLKSYYISTNEKNNILNEFNNNQDMYINQYNDKKNNNNIIKRIDIQKNGKKISRKELSTASRKAYLEFDVDETSTKLNEKNTNKKYPNKNNIIMLSFNNNSNNKENNLNYYKNKYEYIKNKNKPNIISLNSLSNDKSENFNKIRNHLINRNFNKGINEIPKFIRPNSFKNKNNYYYNDINYYNNNYNTNLLLSNINSIDTKKKRIINFDLNQLNKDTANKNLYYKKIVIK